FSDFRLINRKITGCARRDASASWGGGLIREDQGKSRRGEKKGRHQFRCRPFRLINIRVIGVLAVDRGNVVTEMLVLPVVVFLGVLRRSLLVDFVGFHVAYRKSDQ